MGVVLVPSVVNVVMASVLDVVCLVSVVAVLGVAVATGAFVLSGSARLILGSGPVVLLTEFFSSDLSSLPLLLFSGSTSFTDWFP